MVEYELVRHCAPTLAGLKTANLFSVFYSSEEELRTDIRDLNRRLGEKGLRVLPFSYKNNRALIYVYRPRKLAADLSERLTEKFLSGKGYNPLKPGLCLSKLIWHIKNNRIFPHEIGFFLGYPAEDVIGFIDNKDSCKLCGCWKFYHNEQDAKKTFLAFNRCTECLCCKSKQGVPLNERAVAT